MAMLALAQVSQLNWPHGHPHQPQHLNTELRQHAPDVAVLAFVKHDFEPCITFPTAQDFDVFCAKKIAAVRDSPAQ